MPWFTFQFENGESILVEGEKAVDWFMQHGAKNQYELEMALDYVWNFCTYRPVCIEIEAPKVSKKFAHIEPNID
jgi:hypothetical protein